MDSPEAQKWYYSQRADLPAESLLLDTLLSYKTLLGFIIASLIEGQLLTHMLISGYPPCYLGSGWICRECCFLGTAKSPQV